MRTLEDFVSLVRQSDRQAGTSAASAAVGLMLCERLESLQCVIDDRLRDVIALLTPDAPAELDGVEQHAPEPPAEVNLSAQSILDEMQRLVVSDAPAGELRRELALRLDDLRAELGMYRSAT